MVSPIQVGRGKEFLRNPFLRNGIVSHAALTFEAAGVVADAGSKQATRRNTGDALQIAALLMTGCSFAPCFELTLLIIAAAGHLTDISVIATVVAGSFIHKYQLPELRGVEELL